MTSRRVSRRPRAQTTVGRLVARIAEEETAGPAPPPTPRTPLPSTNVGYKLLSKMGWKAGTGLGKSRQGIREPIALESHTRLGLGKAREYDEVGKAATRDRKKLEVEVEETKEVRARRAREAAKETAVAVAVKEMTDSFYCEMCDQRYSKAADYTEHLQSYAHNHKKRFRAMKDSQRAFHRQMRDKARGQRSKGGAGKAKDKAPSAWGALPSAARSARSVKPVGPQRAPCTEGAPASTGGWSTAGASEAQRPEAASRGGWSTADTQGAGYNLGTVRMDLSGGRGRSR